MVQYLINIAQLAKGMTYAPLLELNKIKSGEVKNKTIYQTFILAMLIVFIRASFAPWYRSFSYYDNKYFNKIINTINYPYILCVIEYLSYFWGLFLLVMLSKIFKKGANYKELICLVMSVSVIGIIAQALFLPINYLLAGTIPKTIFILIRLWNLVLIVLAIRVSLSLSYLHSIFIVALTILALIISTCGLWPFMSPYLLFIQYN